MEEIALAVIAFAIAVMRALRTSDQPRRVIEPVLHDRVPVASASLKQA